MLKKILTLYILLLSSLFSGEAILKLDTKGHTSIINDIIVTKEGDIISASKDKTIRIWDSKTGREKRKILGQIESGLEGMIFAIALSSDERYLAVGGFMEYSSKYTYAKDANYIRIYNYQSGKLLKILKSHTDVVHDLAFSPDDKYLISGSSDNTAKIWDTTNWSLKDTIKTHSNYVCSVGIFKKSSRYYAVTAAFDNTISLYDISNKQTIRTHKKNYKLQYLSIGRDHIAASGFSNEISIYDLNLNPIRTVYSETKPAALKYSKDGRYLIAGTTGKVPRNVNIYNTYDYSLKSSFNKHTNAVIAVNFLDNNTAVSGGGNNYEMYIWDILSSQVKKNIQGVGDTIWSVGIKGDKIAWANNWTGDTHTIGSRFEKSIDLNDFKISSIDLQYFKRISTINGSYSLSHRTGGGYGYDDAVLDIKKNGYTTASITRDSTNGYRHRCYGWYKDYVISSGAHGHLKVYDIKGNELASLIGHTGEVWSIAIEGDKLVSGSGDQTIRVWDLKKISQDKIIYPSLNIFVSKENEYIVWSQNGYFTSSVGGDKYVGYHINQGIYKEARYIGSDKYFDTYYRPDIIENILKTGSEKKAIAYASKTKKVKSINVASSLPPVVSLLSSSSIKTKQDSVTVKYQIDSKEPVTETVIIVNGKKLDTRALIIKKQDNIKTLTVDLENGDNVISIKARNKYAFSDEIIINAFKQSNVKEIYKPTLYLLSIGVSEYKNSEFNLGVAHKDAKAISDMFRSQKGKVYKDVKIKTFTNKDATSDSILDGLDWIDKEVTSKDVAVIFIAGHGINDDRGEYYFLSHEANLDRLRRTALPWYEVQRTINNLPSKTILLADTCHSGNIAGTRRDITGAIKSIINSGSGSVIMTATTGNGYSYEQKEWGHGAFTKALLEGVKNLKADYDGDNTITIKEIDLYITNRVKKLTNGKQKPTTIIPASIPDFAIGVK